MTLHLPHPSGITFPPVSLLPYGHTTLSSCRVASEYSPSHPRRARSVGEQASRTGVCVETLARVCAGDQIFGERLRDCSPSSSSPSWWCLYFLGSASSTFRWTFEGRHYVHLPTLTAVHDFEQLTMSGSRATGALSMGPSAGYISVLKLVKFDLFSAMISTMFINIFAANLSSSKSISKSLSNFTWQIL